MSDIRFLCAHFEPEPLAAKWLGSGANSYGLRFLKYQSITMIERNNTPSAIAAT